MYFLDGFLFPFYFKPPGYVSVYSIYKYLVVSISSDYPTLWESKRRLAYELTIYLYIYGWDGGNREDWGEGEDRGQEGDGEEGGEREDGGEEGYRGEGGKRREGGGGGERREGGTASIFTCYTLYLVHCCRTVGGRRC